MRKQRGLAGVVCTAIAVAAFFTLGFVASASATLVGEFTKFQQCPWTTSGVSKCLYSLTTGGKVKLGSKDVPIVNPVLLQGGASAPVKGFSKFFGATNGVTLAPVAQPVPGGLLGLVPPASSPPLVKALVELAAKNGLTGVNATLELAGSASEIELNEVHLAEEEEVAVKLPVKIHLENPFLGEACYVGSNGSPIWWELTTGFTNPPKPYEPIRGAGGTFEFLEEGAILNISGVELVDNAWSAPAASGCGGLLSALVDPVLNVAAGLPSEAGINVAVLKSAISVSTATAVNLNNADN